MITNSLSLVFCLVYMPVCLSFVFVWLLFLSVCLSVFSAFHFCLSAFCLPVSLFCLSFVQKWKSSFCFTLMNRAWPWRVSDFVYSSIKSLHISIFFQFLVPVYLFYIFSFETWMRFTIYFFKVYVSISGSINIQKTREFPMPT